MKTSVTRVIGITSSLIVLAASLLISLYMGGAFDWLLRLLRLMG